MLNKGSRRWLLAASIALAGASVLVPGASNAQEKAQRRWRPPAPNFAAIRATLEDEDGRPLRTFMHDGRTFVLGRFGERYGIRIVNPLDVRVEAVVTVDG